MKNKEAEAIEFEETKDLTPKDNRPVEVSGEPINNKTEPWYNQATINPQSNVHPLFENILASFWNPIKQ